MSLRDDIEEQRKCLSIAEAAFGEVDLHSYEEVLKSIWSRFTKLGHEAGDHFWINQHIENRISYAPSSEKEVTNILKTIIPKNAKYWFIGQETKNEKPKYWLYEGTLNAILEILDNMYLFDFYIVQRKYKWILSEEHHGVLVASGEPISKNLIEYKTSVKL